MASNVSVEEFTLLQQQFLDLRKQNYELLEAASRKELELKECRKRVAKLEKELEAKNFNSSLESTDYLRRENEVLRGRLYLQEEEFQLQQATMHSEVLKLSSQNDELRMLVASLSKSPSADGQNSFSPNSPDTALAHDDGEHSGITPEPKRAERLYQLDEQSTNATGPALDANEGGELNQVQRELDDLRIVHQKLNDYTDRLNAEVAKLQNECQVMERDLSKARNRESDLVATLEIKDFQLESLRRDADEVTATSNKRKELLDEMARYIEELKSKSEAAHCEFEESSNAQIRALKEEVENLTAQLVECKACCASLESLEKELNSANMKLSEMNLLVEQCEQEKEILRSQAEKALLESREALNAEIVLAKSGCADWEKRYNECQKHLASTEEMHKAATDELKKDYGDKLDQAKASLHRQHSVIQDLKKQLRCETKRSERLQEKLGDLLKDVHGCNKREDIGETYSRLHGDSGSNSSWSLVSGIKGDFDKISVTCSDQESVSSVTVLEGEIQELVDRVATLKQKNSELVEKVQILEESSSKMAEDLLSKNSLIERLLRDRRSIFDGPSGLNLKGILDKMRLELFENDARTMNKKLQRLLEETLTKNVYLQKNIETLSQEVLKLSADGSAKQAKGCQEN